MAEDNILELTDEEGIIHKFKLVDMLVLDGKEYVVLLPVDEEDEEAIILRVEGEGEEQSLVTIDDDEEWERVEEAWYESHSADEDDDLEEE